MLEGKVKEISLKEEQREMENRREKIRKIKDQCWKSNIQTTGVPERDNRGRKSSMKKLSKYTRIEGLEF